MQLPQQGIVLKFYDKEFRDKLYDLLKDARKAAHWNVPFKRPDAHVSQIPTVATPSTLSGISAIKKTIENQTKFNQTQISSAFQDLDSLKQKARNLVGIANTIRNKIERQEMTADSEEMKEIQQVMFNMGLVNDFSS